MRQATGTVVENLEALRDLIDTRSDRIEQELRLVNRHLRKLEKGLAELKAKIVPPPSVN